MPRWLRGKWAKSVSAARAGSRSIIKSARSAPTAPPEIIQVLVDRSLDAKKSLTYREYAKLMIWADEFRKLGIRTNADTPEQVANAVAFGAEGIGLCRTEHMFFEGDRIDAMREM